MKDGQGESRPSVVDLFIGGIGLAFLSYITIALKRLKAQRTLSAVLVIAFALVISITVYIPIFADAVGRSVVRENLERKSKSANYPLFSARFYAMPTASCKMTLDDVSYAYDWLADLLARHVSTLPAHCHPGCRQSTWVCRWQGACGAPTF